LSSVAEPTVLPPLQPMDGAANNLVAPSWSAVPFRRYGALASVYNPPHTHLPNTSAAFGEPAQPVAGSSRLNTAADAVATASEVQGTRDPLRSGVGASTSLLQALGEIRTLRSQASDLRAQLDNVVATCESLERHVSRLSQSVHPTPPAQSYPGDSALFSRPSGSGQASHDSTIPPTGITLPGINFLLQRTQNDSSSGRVDDRCVPCQQCFKSGLTCRGI